MKSYSAFERAAQRCTQWMGSTPAFAVACAVVVAWLACGPWAAYSNTWQLAINTSTTIVTFLMVFLIQRAQNKDARAIQLKLNELIASIEGASNSLIDIEDLTESELEVLARRYHTLLSKIHGDATPTQSHSIEEAQRRGAGERVKVRKAAKD